MSESSTGRRGVFVTIEGGDGAGKSTQLDALARFVESEGRRAVTCREPGGTTLGERLRDALFATREGERSPSPEAELLVFNAARAQLVAEVIRPALAAGAVVICDRFTDSTVAYQRYGRGLDASLVRAVNDAATRGPDGHLVPDLTVLLDLEPEQGFARLRSRADARSEGPRQPGGNGAADYVEREGLEFHRRVRRGFLELAAAEPDRWLVLDATKPPMQITDAAWRRLERVLAERA